MRLEWAKEEGLLTACNFMLGFPQETPVELERTLRFMERIAPMVDAFSTMGVVIPFPGTPLYEEFHFLHGFTDWWLREEYSRFPESPPLGDVDRSYRYYSDDANLDLGFFRYSPGDEAAHPRVPSVQGRAQPGADGAPSRAGGPMTGWTIPRRRRLTSRSAASIPATRVRTRN